MTEREKYLFDINGYLVVRNILTDAEVVGLNEAIEANKHELREDGNSNTAGSKFLQGDR